MNFFRNAIGPGVTALLLTAPHSTAIAENDDLLLSPDYTGPSVVIQKYDNRTVEEYSVNGNTYMQKVSPRNGRPYYLVDPNGDGDLQWRRDAVGMDERPPQWSLFSW